MNGLRLKLQVMTLVYMCIRLFLCKNRRQRPPWSSLPGPPVDIHHGVPVGGSHHFHNLRHQVDFSVMGGGGACPHRCRKKYKCSIPKGYSLGGWRTRLAGPAAPADPPKVNCLLKDLVKSSSSILAASFRTFFCSSALVLRT
jgi:hypothetical protein